MKFSEVVGALERTYELFTDKSSPKNLLRSERRFAQTMLDELPYVSLVLTSGYPSYLPHKRGAYLVGEIGTHVGTMLEKARKISGEVGEDYVWPCPSCVDSNGLPNLRDRCNPCTETPMKPRDVYETLLDMDFFIVVDGQVPDVENDVWETCARHGYHPSERVMREAVMDFPGKLCVDMNIVSASDFDRALWKFANSGDEWIKQQEEARILWLKPETRTWYFGMDMGLTTGIAGWRNPADLTRFYDALRTFKSSHTYDQFMTGMANAPKSRVRRLVSMPSVQYSLQERYDRTFSGEPFS